MKIKTSELTDAALDWAVAKANGWVDFSTDSGGADQYWFLDAAKAPFCRNMRKKDFQPSTDWAQAGPIIEHKKITLSFNHDFQIWEAGIVNKAGDDFVVGHGPTPLIAAMRCHVTSELGDEIDIPDELTKEPS